MYFLARELDDPTVVACGRCANCRGVPLLPEQISAGMRQRAVQFLRRNDQIIVPRRQWPVDGLAAHDWQGNIAQRLQLHVGRALCVWGDDGWGGLVELGKQTGYFDDALVSAAVELIRARWRPKPFPTWVTCVPSLSNPDLVPHLAQRLANALTVSFAACIRKKRPTEPQKTMENSYQQAHNLENAFEIVSWSGLGGPVLLVDDMVDSGWTFTVVGALLRAAGSGPVFPFALAVTSKQE